MTGGAITGAEIGARETAEVLLPSVKVAPVSLSLPTRRNFSGEVRQVKDRAIRLVKYRTFDKSSQDG